MTPFSFVDAINQSKEDLFQDPQAEKEYVPFIVNRAFSYFIDTVMIANEMNQYPDLPKKQQFDFYRNSVSKKKRWSKWLKNEKDDNLQMIMDYYQISRQKALTYMKLLSKDDIEEIGRLTFTGGK